LLFVSGKDEDTMTSADADDLEAIFR